MAERTPDVSSSHGNDRRFSEITFQFIIERLYACFKIILKLVHYTRDPKYCTHRFRRHQCLNFTYLYKNDMRIRKADGIPEIIKDVHMVANWYANSSVRTLLRSSRAGWRARHGIRLRRHGAPTRSGANAQVLHAWSREANKWFNNHVTHVKAVIHSCNMCHAIITSRLFKNQN